MFQEKHLYVLDGLLENNTILEIKEHTTDTEGYTRQLRIRNSGTIGCNRE